MGLKWLSGIGKLNKFDVLNRINITQDGTLEIDGQPQQSTGGGNAELLAIKQVWSGNANITKTFSSSMYGFDIANDGNSDLTFTINGLTITVKSGEVFSDVFEEFTSVTITTTVPYRATVKESLSGTLPPSPSPSNDDIPPVISISPVASTYTGSQQITLSSNETANIYYTIDGTTPTISSTKYTAPFTISTTTTVKYFGVDSAGNQSTVQSASYTINQPDTTPPNPVTNLVAGTTTTTSIPITWTKSTSTDVANYEVAYSTDNINFTVASSSVNASSTSYTVNGLTSNTSYTIRVVAIDASNNRSTSVTVTATTAVATDTTPPVDVTNLIASNVTDTSLTLSWTASASMDIASYDVYNGSTLLGNTASTTYNVTGLTASTSYTFKVVSKDMNGNVSIGVTVTQTTNATPVTDTTPPTITANPVGASYTSAQSVTLTSDETATIYYTTDGTNPTTSSSVYSAPISISDTTTLKYFGVDSAGNQSGIQTQTYTVNSTTIGTDVIYVDTGNMLVVPMENLSWKLNTSYTNSSSTVIQTSYPLSTIFDISSPSTAVNLGASFVYVSSTTNLSDSANTFTFNSSSLWIKINATNGTTVDDVITYINSQTDALRIKLISNYQVLSLTSNISNTTTRSDVTVGFQYFKCKLNSGVGNFVQSITPYEYLCSNGYLYESSYVWTQTKPCIKVNTDSTLEMLVPDGTLATINDTTVSTYLSNASIEVYYHL